MAKITDEDIQKAYTIYTKLSAAMVTDEHIKLVVYKTGVEQFILDFCVRLTRDKEQALHLLECMATQIEKTLLTMDGAYERIVNDVKSK